jgi:hypothetical protein
VSRWLSSPLAIGVGTRELAIGVRASRLPRLRKAAPVAAHTRIDMLEEHCFTEQGVLDALRAALSTDADEAAPPALPRRRAFVVLDDFWGNHAILRGDFRTLRARELEEIALAHFADTYGMDVGSVLVRFRVQRGGRALFASAMSRALHDGIHEVSTTARVTVESLRLCLPEMLNRVRRAVDGGQAMLVFVADTLMQAVMVEHNSWVAYDAQRLFPGDVADASRLAVLAEQVFERSATTRREDCKVYLFGIDADPEPFETRFTAAIRLPLAATGSCAAHRLMEYAQ